MYCISLTSDCFLGSGVETSWNIEDTSFEESDCINSDSFFVVDMICLYDFGISDVMMGFVVINGPKSLTGCHGFSYYDFLTRRFFFNSSLEEMFD